MEMTSREQRGLGRFELISFLVIVALVGISLLVPNPDTPSAPELFQAGEVWLDIFWNAPIVECPGRVCIYMIDRKTGDIDEWVQHGEPVQYTDDYGQLTAKVEGLEPSKQYEFRVRHAIALTETDQIVWGPTSATSGPLSTLSPREVISKQQPTSTKKKEQTRNSSIEKIATTFLNASRRTIHTITLLGAVTFLISLVRTEVSNGLGKGLDWIFRSRKGNLVMIVLVALISGFLMDCLGFASFGKASEVLRFLVFGGISLVSILQSNYLWWKLSNVDNFFQHNGFAFFSVLLPLYGFFLSLVCRIIGSSVREYTTFEGFDLASVHLVLWTIMVLFLHVALSLFRAKPKKW